MAQLNYFCASKKSLAMTLHTIWAILQQTIIITIFILGMMMVIEYVNVRTGGLWSKKIQKSPWLQIILGALMGIIPGCIGTYTIVSLFVHRVVAFPALVATLVATSGDEAFFMFSLFPTKALTITALLFVIAIAVGCILQLTMRNRNTNMVFEGEFHIHNDSDGCVNNTKHNIISNLKKASFLRIALVLFSVGVICLVSVGAVGGEHNLNLMMGGMSEESVIHSVSSNSMSIGAPLGDAHALPEEIHHHHHHEGESDWISILLIVLFAAILLISLRADEHFLKEHIWNHVIKVHLPKVFLWTFGMILGLSILNNYVNIQNWISDNLWLVLLIAVLVGIIPESGPHLLFVILFWQGSLPMSILLASSIVQDGHGSLPLLAESRKAFLVSKAMSVLVGLIVGSLGLVVGF